MNKEDLTDEFREETGKCTMVSDDVVEPHYTLEYVDWLENKYLDEINKTMSNTKESKQFKFHYLPETYRKEPYKCPICGGNGLVPNGFYGQTSGYWSTSSTTPETCRTCKGEGIVWK